MPALEHPSICRAGSSQRFRQQVRLRAAYWIFGPISSAEYTSAKMGAAVILQQSYASVLNRSVSRRNLYGSGVKSQRLSSVVDREKSLLNRYCRGLFPNLRLKTLQKFETVPKPL